MKQFPPTSLQLFLGPHLGWGSDNQLNNILFGILLSVILVRSPSYPSPFILQLFPNLPTFSSLLSAQTDRQTDRQTHARTRTHTCTCTHTHMHARTYTHTKSSKDSKQVKQAIKQSKASGSFAKHNYTSTGMPVHYSAT